MEIFLCRLLQYNLKVIYKKSNSNSKIFKMVNVCQFNFGQFWSILFDFGQFWSILVNSGQFWSILVNFGQFWSILVNSGQFWSILVNSGQIWSVEVVFGQFGSFRYFWPCLVKNGHKWSISVIFGQLGVDLNFIMKRKSPLVLQSIRFLGIDGKMAKKATNQHMAIIILDFFRVKIRSIFFGKQSMTHLIK